MQRHLRDEYVKRAQQDGYPSRAAYKLLELHEKYKLFKPNMNVVDLGAAPGGWSMVARQQIGRRGRVIALDRLPMDPIDGVTFIQGDFTEEAILQQLLDACGGEPIDLVLSDMAPNLAGQKSIDQPRSVYLVELALDCAAQILKPGGSFVAKVFQGAGVDTLFADIKKQYQVARMRKPKASRASSREVYIVASGFVG